MAKPNALLDSIKKSKDYIKFRKLTRETLAEQWEDMTYSGIVKQLHNDFAPIFEKYKLSKQDIIKATSPTRRAANKAILSGQAKSLDQLQRYIKNEVTGIQEKVGGYSGYGQAVKSYMYEIMEKGGQAEINRYLGGNVYEFRLSKQYYINLVNDRVTNLIKTVDNTTAEKFARQLTRGLAAGDSKQDLVNRLLKINPEMAKWRAERIVKTETAAAVEFMRHETARLNGIEFKVWHVTGSNPCHLCEPMDGIAIAVGDSFPFVELDYPPVHPNCECSCDYLLDPLDVLGYDTSHIDDNILEALHQTISKSSDNQLWKPVITKPLHKFNPLAVWVGGEGLAGADKNVAKYLKEIQTEGFVDFKDVWANTTWAELDTWAKHLENLSEIHGKMLFKDVAKFKQAVSVTFVDYLPAHVQLGRSQYVWMVLVQARASLSDAGFEQLIRQLGVSSPVKPRNL